MKAPPRWIYRLVPFVPLLVLLAAPALARVGSGESYDSGRSSSGGDDGALIDLFIFLVRIAIEYPCVGIPLIVIFIVVVWYMKRQEGSASTRKALDAAEAARRTTVSARDADAWVQALKAKDPQFDLMAFFDRTRRLFGDVQEAWFRRNLEPVRRFLSDATFRRLSTQLVIMQSNGVRDAIADLQVLDLQLIGLEQTSAFDSVHVRVKAQLRDDDAPATLSDDEARALAKKKAPETFTEVWTFLRRPGVQTDATKNLSQGNCPNCGAPFAGGATNTCEFCGAIVNSGHHDWVLAEITQGSEYERKDAAAQGLVDAQRTDAELAPEILEDRASLLFWSWVEAQVANDVSRLVKVATPDFTARLKADLDSLSASGRQKVFVECAVGAVNTLSVSNDGDRQLAHFEIRWSARTGIGPKGQKPPPLPTVPQRWVFTLSRKAGAVTPPDAGVSTARCPNCHAPLSDNGSPSCEFCGTALATGERDWVLTEVTSWEGFVARRGTTPRRPGPEQAAARVPDREERERLLYLMAAMAVSDGVVDAKERQLLKLCSERWGVPWANVELALSSGPSLFDRLISRGSAEAESFLRELVQMALVDGKIDRKERKLLEAAAGHLGLGGRLDEFLR
ncbi:MAG: TIM44-like domain-containing protein [Myxococcaceae bacterium]|jgi:tellurite resistance protein|nr:TIM44-like domain-containing protein [Myxococcaceae bacterium]